MSTVIDILNRIFPQKNLQEPKILQDPQTLCLAKLALIGQLWPLWQYNTKKPITGASFSMFMDNSKRRN